MSTLLCLLRHGLASGQGPSAPLRPEGEADVAALGRRLAREGFAPAAAYASPYLRARDTANILLGELGSSVQLVLVRELTPDVEPGDALDALEARGLPGGPVLVVTHLPLVARLAVGLTDEPVDFRPGTYAEIELDARSRRGVLRRRIGPEDPAA